MEGDAEQTADLKVERRKKLSQLDELKQIDSEEPTKLPTNKLLVSLRVPDDASMRLMFAKQRLTSRLLKGIHRDDWQELRVIRPNFSSQETS